MYIQQLGEIVLPPRHNTLGVCHQISFLVLYYNISQLVPLLEVINAPIQVPDIVDLTVSFQFLDFTNTIQKILMPQHHPPDKYARSGAYRLTCPDCNKVYVGQTGCSFTVTFREH